MIFELAWHGKGFNVELTRVPNHVLEWFREWNNEAVKEEKNRERQQ